MPLAFIESQYLFEQGEIWIAESLPCLAAMLTDFLFLHGAPHPRESILPVELFQCKEVFRQQCFPLIKRLHFFLLIITHERDLSSWKDAVY